MAVPHAIVRIQESGKIAKHKKRRYGSEVFDDVFASLGKETTRLLYNHFPSINFSVNLKSTTKVVARMRGPHEEEAEDNQYAAWAKGTATTTYPKGVGDPICDSFAVETLEDDVVIAVVTDGCGWGSRPMEASKKARDAFVEYIKDNLSNMYDLRDVGHYLLQSISACQNRITAGFRDLWESGTTTMLGGILIPIRKDVTGKPAFVWAFVSIGDCKTLHFQRSDRSTTDLNAETRLNCHDAKDPGGRLGPQTEGGKADLRNVYLQYRICQEDDMLLLVSDGVSDNLDPQMLGKSPAEAAQGQGVNIPQWSGWDQQGDQPILQQIKTTYMQKLLSLELIPPTVVISPTSVTDSIINHCIRITAAGREFLETRPTEPLPHDYVAYPGKMDHTTCLTLRVGRHSRKEEERESKTRYSTDGIVLQKEPKAHHQIEVKTQADEQRLVKRPSSRKYFWLATALVTVLVLLAVGALLVVLLRNKFQ